MKIGYARTSTLDQQAGFQAQIAELKAAGCEKLYQEQVSSIGDRPQLEAALSFVREGDTFVVTKMDRLARSIMHMGRIIERIEGKGASLQILNLGLDTGTATGKLMLNIMGSIAEFERAMMLERQKEGVAKAKADGKYKGRKPTVQLRAAEVLALSAQGVGPVEIARRLGIGRTSIYRILVSDSANSAGVGAGAS